MIDWLNALPLHYQMLISLSGLCWLCVVGVALPLAIQEQAEADEKDLKEYKEVYQEFIAEGL